MRGARCFIVSSMGAKTKLFRLAPGLTIGLIDRNVVVVWQLDYAPTSVVVCVDGAVRRLFMNISQVSNLSKCYSGHPYPRIPS